MADALCTCGHPAIDHYGPNGACASPGTPGACPAMCKRYASALPQFTHLTDSCRVVHERREVITSGTTRGVPPVSTRLWDADAWARWDANTARVQALEAECVAAGYRLVTL